MVGAHAGEDELRAKEYIPGTDLDRFVAHERFFVEELAAWAERNLGATTERALRAVFGFSNGGVFVGEMTLRHPERFGVAMTFSAGIPPDTKRSRPASDVRVYLAVGLFDEGFYRATRAFAVQLQQAGAQVVFSARAAGHDYGLRRGTALSVPAVQCSGVDPCACSAIPRSAVREQPSSRPQFPVVRRRERHKGFCAQHAALSGLAHKRGTVRAIRGAVPDDSGPRGCGRRYGSIA
jgi:pimeloyl-ACP methyl ester carboxylesterase